MAVGTTLLCWEMHKNRDNQGMGKDSVAALRELAPRTP